VKLAPLLVLVSCGAHEEKIVRLDPQPQPLPHHVEIVDAGSQPTPGVCIEARDAGVADFAAARALFTSKKWAEAAPMYRAIAFASPDDPSGIYAAELYLESLNQLMVAGNKVCFDDMERDLPPLRALYCGARRAKNESECTMLDRIELDIGRSRAQAFSERQDWASAARMYAALLKTWCMPASQSHCDEIAYNAAVSFLATGDEASAKRMRAVLADPKNKMDKSPLIEKLDCRIDPASRPSCH
jgi:hypothetical protein